MVGPGTGDPRSHPAVDAATALHRRQEASTLFERGRLPEAERALDDLVADLGTPGTLALSGELARALIAQATVLRLANRWEEALASLGRAEDVVRDLPLARPFTLNIHHIRTKLLADPDSPVYDPSAAADELALLRRDARLAGMEWIADELESDLAFRAGDWAKTVSVGARAAEALTRLGWPAAVAGLRLRFGDAWLELGDLQRAEAENALADEHLARWGAPDMRAHGELQLARIRSRQGDHDAAWGHAVGALDGFDSLIRNFRVLSEQQRFLADKLRAYGQAFGIARAAGDAPSWLLRAWTVAERAKSFSLCQLVANADVPFLAAADPAQRARMKQLDETLDRLERDVAPGTPAQPQQPHGDEELSRVHAERQALLDQLMAENPRWSALRRPPPLALEDELAGLHAGGWSPLSFYWQEEETPAARQGRRAATLHTFFSPAPGVIEHREVPWSAAERERLAAARAALSGRVPGRAKLCAPELVEKILPSSYRTGMADADGPTLLISAHQDLHMLPLHAFGDEGERLMDRRPFQYIPTLALLPLARESEASGAVAAIGCPRDGFPRDQPLPQIPGEIDDIARIWSARNGGRVCSALIPADGTVEGAQIPASAWAKFQYLHVACHGYFPETRPFDAELRLGREAIRMASLFEIQLNASLVTFSACSLGRHVSGDRAGQGNADEWVGMYLPLFYAGASDLLLSLWDADSDDARKLMPELHRQIANQHHAPALALKDALRVVEDDPEAFWANWYLVGIPHTARRSTDG
jgi:hypothetical protein